MTTPTADQLLEEHSGNPYVMDAQRGCIHFSWNDINADLVAVQAAREHLKKAAALISGIKAECDDIGFLADELKGFIEDEVEPRCFGQIEKWSKDASEEMWVDA